MGSLSLLQGIFPTQRLNPGLLHCRQVLHQLNHKGSPRVLEWVAYLFSSGSSWPRNWTGVSHVTGRFFTSWAIREAKLNYIFYISPSNTLARQLNSVIDKTATLGYSQTIIHFFPYQSVQSLSCVQLFAKDPNDCSTPGFPVHHQLQELAQTHVHRVGKIFK